jgi:hypothetical protein
LSYTTAVQGWRDFYLVAGTAAATLVGLLFVGLSLHLRIVVSRPDVGGLARVTLGNFGAVLFVSLFMAVPGNAESAGTAITIIGAVTLVIVVRSLHTVTRSERFTLAVRQLTLRLGFSTLAALTLVASGLLLINRVIDKALYALLAASVALLVVSLRNSWDLLVSVGAATHSERDHSD